MSSAAERLKHYPVDEQNIEKDLKFLVWIKVLDERELLGVLRTPLEHWQSVAVRRTLIKLIEAQEALEEKLGQ